MSSENSSRSRTFRRDPSGHTDGGEGSRPMTKPLDYKSAGVDIDVADDAKHRIKKLVESTFTAGARGAFGGFGGMFRVPTDVPKPVLVSSADGVGTKLKVAIEAGERKSGGEGKRG